MMKDVVQHGTAYGSVWAAGFHLPAAAKTGTTNDYNDVWFIGYTADLVAGVWMGMDRPVKIMHDAQGGRLAGPAWTAFMTEVYRRKPPPPDWPRPEGLSRARHRPHDRHAAQPVLSNELWCTPSGTSPGPSPWSRARSIRRQTRVSATRCTWRCPSVVALRPQSPRRRGRRLRRPEAAIRRWLRQTRLPHIRARRVRRQVREPILRRLVRLRQPWACACRPTVRVPPGGHDAACARGSHAIATRIRRGPTGTCRLKRSSPPSARGGCDRRSPIM